jgi:hypothetical protein
MRRKVAGLRDYEKPPVCRVFQANPDGTVGKLLRIEEPVEYNQIGNNGRKGK